MVKLGGTLLLCTAIGGIYAAACWSRYNDVIVDGVEGGSSVRGGAMKFTPEKAKQFTDSMLFQSRVLGTVAVVSGISGIILLIVERRREGRLFYRAVDDDPSDP